MKQYKYLWLLLILCMGLGVGVMQGVKYFSASSVSPVLKTAQLLPLKKSLPDFSLENSRGDIVDKRVLETKWSLILFGFTSCPDVCPMELQKLSRVLTMADNPLLQVVFVSVDPERDTAEKLVDYVKFFHAGIVGVRGTHRELASLAHFFGAIYDRTAIVDNNLLSIPAGADMPTNIASDYSVSHSLRLFIINPAGEYIGSFAPPYEPDAIWNDVQILMHD